MSFFNWFSGLFDDSFTGFESVTDSVSEQLEVNPASGLLMVGGIGGVDSEGNPYGTDNSNTISCDVIDTGLNDHSSCSTVDMFDSDTSSSFDDSYSTGSGFDSWQLLRAEDRQMNEYLWLIPISLLTVGLVILVRKSKRTKKLKEQREYFVREA